MSAQGGSFTPQPVKFFAVLLLASFLAACQPVEASPPLTSTTFKASPSTISAGEPTALHTNIATVISTMSPVEAEKKVIELLGDNADCELPCLWGITPGITTYEDTVNFFRNLGWSGSADYGYYSTGKNFQASQLAIRVGIFSSSAVVEKLHLALGGNEFGEYVGDYSIRNTLNSLGAPSEILVYISIDDGFLAEQTMFDLILYYGQKGLLLEYPGTANKHDSLYTICPTKPNLHASQQDAGSGNVSLYLDVNKGTSIGEVLRPFWVLAYDYRSVDDAFGIDVEEFTKKILEGGDYPCFETSIGIWGE